MRARLRNPATAARKARSGRATKVPGPSSNPATNLLILDIALRGASMLVSRALERGVLRTGYGAAKASDIVRGRSTLQTMAATGAARMATRSVPGLLLVAGGLFAKVVLDRSLKPRDAARRGEQRLAEQAAEGDED